MIDLNERIVRLDANSSLELGVEAVSQLRVALSQLEEVDLDAEMAKSIEPDDEKSSKSKRRRKRKGKHSEGRPEFEGNLDRRASKLREEARKILGDVITEEALEDGEVVYIHDQEEVDPSEVSPEEIIHMLSLRLIKAMGYSLEEVSFSEDYDDYERAQYESLD